MPVLVGGLESPPSGIRDTEQQVKSGVKEAATVRSRTKCLVNWAFCGALDRT